MFSYIPLRSGEGICLCLSGRFQILGGVEQKVHFSPFQHIVCRERSFAFTTTHSLAINDSSSEGLNTHFPFAKKKSSHDLASTSPRLDIIYVIFPFLLAAFPVHSRRGPGSGSFIFSSSSTSQSLCCVCYDTIQSPVVCNPESELEGGGLKRG